MFHNSTSHDYSTVKVTSPKDFPLLINVITNYPFTLLLAQQSSRVTMNKEPMHLFTLQVMNKEPLYKGSCTTSLCNSLSNSSNNSLDVSAEARMDHFRLCALLLQMKLC